jgi:mono/diheme cytochrome c family protein
MIEGRVTLAACIAAVAVMACVRLLPAMSGLPAAVLPAQNPNGAQIYANTCAACHQPNGAGKDEQFPPLAGSEWATGPEGRIVRIVLHGLTGEIDVEGQLFSGLMPPLGAALKDDEIAAVATYVRSSWGNKASAVTPATVARIRKEHASRTTPWTAAELARLAVPVTK